MIYDSKFENKAHQASCLRKNQEYCIKLRLIAKQVREKTTGIGLDTVVTKIILKL